MLSGLLGNENKEKILLYIYARNEGYARQISEFYQTSLTPIQNQLDNLEFGGVLTSRLLGRTRVYTFNNRYPLLSELKSLLEKDLSLHQQDLVNQLTMNRRRPRRKNKPLPEPV